MIPPKLTLTAILLLSIIPYTVSGQSPDQVIPAGETPRDSRLGPPKDLNGHFPFSVPENLAAWESRAEQLKRQILVSTGLWPLPEKTPLNAVIHGKVDRDGFTVEKVYFESVPNHFVTGLLFRPDRPAPQEGFPAVLCPHGHGGRLQDLGEKGVREEISQGFERFESSGRFPAIARCAQLARMGCVTFIYDMIGYGDSNQISYDIAHRSARQRINMEGTDRWGFYSVSAEQRLQSIMGLQTWNSVRSLDFLAGLPDVNAARMAVTGNSGGGTQTILLGAIDSRPIAYFPNGMVSTSMQGGCYCENCCGLRVGTGNVELTALFAPRPAGMTAVDDWTRDMMTDGYPELQKLYALYGKRDNVLCKSYPHFPHNYNYVTRSLMYKFFNKHLSLGLDEPIVEEDFKALTAEEYTVWNDNHPRPEAGDEYEKRLLRDMSDASDRHLAQLRVDEPEKFLQVVRSAYETLIGRTFPSSSDVELIESRHEKGANYQIHKGLLNWKDSGERIPLIILTKIGLEKPQGIALVIETPAKSNLWNDLELRPEILDFLNRDHAIVAFDMFAAGENRTPEFGDFAQRWVDDNRYYAAFTYGYNPTTFARRTHDLMNVLAYLENTYPSLPTIIQTADETQPILEVAQFLQGKRKEVPFSEFDFSKIKSYRDAGFLPGARKYAITAKAE